MEIQDVYYLPANLSRVAFAVALGSSDAISWQALLQQAYDSPSTCLNEVIGSIANSLQQPQTAFVPLSVTAETFATPRTIFAFPVSIATAASDIFTAPDGIWPAISWKACEQYMDEVLCQGVISHTYEREAVQTIPVTVYPRVGIG